MFSQIECSHNKKTEISSVYIKSLRKFSKESFDKLKKIILSFNTQTLFFFFVVCEKDIHNFCELLRNIKGNSKVEIFKSYNIYNVAYSNLADNLSDIFKIVENFKLEESLFYEAKNFPWEQYVLNIQNGKLEKELSKLNVTDALFSIYAHDGYHHILFNTKKYDYKKTILYIKSVLNN